MDKGKEKQKQKKPKILLEVDQELKQEFADRLKCLVPRYHNVSLALRLAMYMMLEYENEELERFLASGESIGVSAPEYRRQVRRAKDSGLLREDIPVGNPVRAKLQTALTMYEQGELDEEETRKVLRHLEAIIDRRGKDGQARFREEVLRWVRGDGSDGETEEES